MIRIFAAALFLLFGVAVAPAPAAEPAESATAAIPSTLDKFAWMWSDKNGAAPPRQYVPVAACTLDCCCQFFAGGSMKNQCKSHDDCINAGGICNNKTSAKCN